MSEKPKDPAATREPTGFNIVHDGPEPDAAAVEQLTNALEKVVNTGGFAGGRSFDRRTIAALAGRMYDGQRDLFKAAGYPAEGQLQGRTGLPYFWSAYGRSDVAARIVDLYPAKCWGKSPTFVDPDGDPEKPSETTQALNDLFQRLHLWRTFEEVDVLARLGQYAILVLGVKGQGAVDEDFRRELGSFELGDLMHVTPYDQRWVNIETFETNPGTERFGHVSAYRVDLSAGVETFEATQVILHWTRCLHVAENTVTDRVFGTPALRRVWNRMVDSEKVLASTGEGFWQTADPFWRLKLAEDADLTKEQREDIKEEAQTVLLQQLHRLFVSQNADLDRIEVNTPDPSMAAITLERRMAVASDYPQRVLFGSQSGERASTEDMKQFLGEVDDRRQNYCEPSIIRPFVERLKEHGAIPADYQYEVSWPPLFAESRKDQAETDRITAEAARALVPVGGDPLTVVETDPEGRLALRPVEAEETATDMDPELADDASGESDAQQLLDQLGDDGEEQELPGDESEQE